MNCMYVGCGFCIEICFLLIFKVSMYLFSLISLNVKLNAQNEFLGVQNANENDMIKYNYWAHGTRSNIVDASSFNSSNVVSGSGNGIGGGGRHCLGSKTCCNWQGVGEKIASIGNRSHSSNWSWCRFFMNIRFSSNFFMNIWKSSWSFSLLFCYIRFSFNLHMLIRFSSNFFMNIRLSSNFLMDIRKSLWNHFFFLRSWSSNSKGNKAQSQNSFMVQVSCQQPPC